VLDGADDRALDGGDRHRDAAAATIDDALPARSPTPSAPTQRELLRRYVDAWGRADVDGLVVVLHRRDDAGDLEPHAILVLEVDGDAIAGLDAYIDPALFPFVA
jgi:hypothetical protein